MAISFRLLALRLFAWQSFFPNRWWLEEERFVTGHSWPGVGDQGGFREMAKFPWEWDRIFGTSVAKTDQLLKILHLQKKGVTEQRGEFQVGWSKPTSRGPVSISGISQRRQSVTAAVSPVTNH